MGPDDNSSISIPLVCKQFWAEASTTFFAINEFIFSDHLAFRALTLASPKFVARIRMLTVLSDPGYSCSGTEHFANHWGAALNSALLGYFKSLIGIRLIIEIREGDYAIMENTDVMSGGRWKKMTEVIRAFQQHQLEHSLTSVQFATVWLHTLPMPAKARVVEDAIKAKLLEHHPRRTSKRG